MVSGVIAIAQAMTCRTSRRRMVFLPSGATNAGCNTETRYEFLRILDCDLVRGPPSRAKGLSGWPAWHVRFGSKADIAAYSINVCFTPESGHRLGKLACPLVLLVARDRQLEPLTVADGTPIT